MAGSRSRSSAHSSPLDLSRFDYTAQAGRMAALVEVFKVVSAYQCGELGQLPDFVGMPASLGALVRRLCDSAREMRETLAARLRDNDAAEVEEPDSPAVAGSEAPPVRFERAGTGTVIDSTSELHVQFWNNGDVSFSGTRAALEAEGLIPPGTEWPERLELTKWQSGNLTYRLWRCCPAGQRLPRKVWIQLDSWRVETSRTDRPHDGPTIALQRKLKEFQQASYRASPEGRAEARLQSDRYFEALRDQHFHAFKTQLLASARKPGRKGQARAQEGGAQ